MITEGQIWNASEIYANVLSIDDLNKLNSSFDFRSGARWALEQQEWISVKEQLPEIGKYVLCNEGESVYISSFNGYDSNEEIEFLCLEGQISVPTHWMPIPEPFKTDEK